MNIQVTKTKTVNTRISLDQAALDKIREFLHVPPGVDFCITQSGIRFVMFDFPAILDEEHKFEVSYSVTEPLES